MKLAIFLLLSWFVASNCTAATIETLKKISRDPFGKTIIDAVQLELQSSSGADPRPRILSLLKEIKDEAIQAIADLNDRHAEHEQQYQSTQQRLQNEIDELDAQIASNSADVTADSKELETITTTRDANKALLDLRKEYLQQITDQRKQDQEAFEKEDNRRAQIEDVLTRTGQFISDRIAARQSASASFLEKDNVLIQVKETVLSTEFQKLSPGWGQLIAFIATKALHKLSQDEDANAVQGLQSIVNLINQILSDTSSFRISAQAANLAAQQVFDEDSTNTQNDITSLNLAISGEDGQIQVLEDSIASLKAAIESDSKLVADKEEELKDSQDRQKKEQADYNNELNTRNAQVQLIEEVEVIVNTDLTTASEFTNDKIANADIVVD